MWTCWEAVPIFQHQAVLMTFLDCLGWGYMRGDKGSVRHSLPEGSWQEVALSWVHEEACKDLATHVPCPWFHISWPGCICKCPDSLSITLLLLYGMKKQEWRFARWYRRHRRDDRWSWLGHYMSSCRARKTCFPGLGTFKGTFKGPQGPGWSGHCRTSPVCWWGRMVIQRQGLDLVWGPRLLVLPLHSSSLLMGNLPACSCRCLCSSFLGLKFCNCKWEMKRSEFCLLHSSLGQVNKTKSSD